jgi:phage head maturation protease
MTLEGYIIEFAAENHQYFSCLEEIFRKGAHDRLLREISLWIKLFLMEEGMITIPSTNMAA